MATRRIDDRKLVAIGDAIRSKLGVEDVYRVDDMPEAIESIETEAVIEQKNISSNGTYTAPTGVDGYSPVVVNVPNSYSASDEGKVVDNGALVAQTSRTIDTNGTYDTTLNNEVVVDVEGGSATLIPKTITENGTYDPSDDDADGYNEVIVNVPNSYSASDEGKVVDDGELVEQTSITVTENDTYDTTTNNEVLVNIPDVRESKTDRIPYNFRESFAWGCKSKGTIVGGTVNWNQLYGSYVSSKTENGVTFTVNTDKTITVSGTATDNTWFSLGYTFGARKNVGHKFYLAGCPQGGSNQTYYCTVRFIGSERDTGNGIIYNVPDTEYTGGFSLFIASGIAVSFTVKPQIIDLTAMFGSTIADYIYSLEQANTGDGVAWFKKYFPKDYYEYNSGSLESVNVSAHKMVGFNQWDEEWEQGGISISNGQNVSVTNTIRSKNYNRCVGNTVYSLTVPTNDNYIFWYDGNFNFIGYTYLSTDRLATSPSNACFIRLRIGSYGNVYNNDICINLSNPDKNGEYEPYEEHVYPLDESKDLRGIPKLDSSNNLVYDGDVYEYDGTVTRNYTIRAYQSGDESLADAITDGTNTVVKLVTPTTESADPYTYIQKMDINGTEEFIDYAESQGTRDVAIPVGHETEYYYPTK